MSSVSSSIVFDDIFTISDIDKDGKKFDRGSIQKILFFLILTRLSVQTLRAFKKLRHGSYFGLQH